MVCKNCGANLPDATRFCTSCGATVENDAMQAPIAGGAAASKSKSKIMKLAIPVVALVAVIVALVLIFGGSYKSTVGKFFSAIESGSGSKLQACYPLDVKMKKAEGESSSEIKEYYQEQAEEIHDELAEEYGDNFKIKYKITDAEKADEEDLEALEDLMNMGIAMSDSDMKDVKVSAGYEVEIEATIKGSEGEDTEEITLTLIKVDGKWNIIDF